MKHLTAAPALACLIAIGALTPAHAQVDLSGWWVYQDFQTFMESVPGPAPVSYMGIPLNKDGRAGALSFNDESLSELQRQCEPYSVQYLVQGPWSFGITPVRNDALAGEQAGAVAGWNISSPGSVFDIMPTTVWTDGRPPPSPQALHTWNGFTSGIWHGDTLVTTTTHIKDGILDREGVPSSNQEVARMFITRHGDVLTITAIIHDPVYLSAPYPIAQVFTLRPNFPPPVPAMHCSPAGEDPNLASGYKAAAYLPWGNPLVQYMPEHYGIPLDAALGGAQTMYPEFRKTLQGKYQRPSGYCKQYCCGSTAGPPGFDVTVLKCHVGD